MTKKGVSLTPAPSYSMISVPLPHALPAPEFVVHSPGWMWWSHLVGVWRSWIKSRPTHVRLSSRAARAAERAEKVGRCLCKTPVCHLWKVLEIKGGPGDWRKANGTPWLQKMPKGSFCNSARASAKCSKWEGLTPDSDTGGIGWGTALQKRPGGGGTGAERKPPVCPGSAEPAASHP